MKLFGRRVAALLVVVVMGGQTMAIAPQVMAWQRGAANLPGPPVAAASPPPGIPFLTDRLDSTARIVVEAAFGADVKGNPNLWNWYDISGDVRQADGQRVTISPMGRSDETSQAQPAGCQFQLDNTAGDYSKSPASRWWPYVRRNTPIRVRLYANGGYSTRFQGYANGWVPSWDTSGNLAVVTVSASGILRRLQQGKTPLRSALYRDISRSDPFAYWPLEDGSDTTEPASATGGSPGASSGAGVKFGAAGPVGASTGLELVSTTRGSTDATVTSSVSLPLGVASGGSFVGVTFWFMCDPLANAQSGLSQGFTSLMWASGGAGDVNGIYVEAANGPSSVSTPYLRARVYSGTTLRGDIQVFTPTIADPLNGSWHQVQVRLTRSGADIIADLYLDDTKIGTSTISSHTIGAFDSAVIPGVGAPAGSFGAYYRDPAFVASDEGGLPVNYGHVAVWTDPTMPDTYQAGLGYAGETTTARLTRLCGEEDVPLAATGTSNVTMGPQGTDTFLNLLRECEATDHGVLADGLGPGLRYNSRAARYNLDPAITADAGADPPQVAAPFAPADDDQRNRNLWKVDRKKGSSATVEDVTGPLGTAEIGTYDSSATVNTSTDDVLAAHAGFLVRHGTVQEPYRYPSLNLDLAANPALVAPWLATGDQIRLDVTNITDRAIQHPPGDVALLVEGYSETLSPFDWSVTANCSPFEPWRVAVIEGGDSDTQWRIDSGASTLAQDYAAGVTSLSVSVSDGYLWSTSAADYPRDLDVGGVKVTVTAVSGAASPQTFTVSATSYALPAGSTVALWRPPKTAL